MASDCIRKTPCPILQLKNPNSKIISKYVFSNWSSSVITCIAVPTYKHRHTKIGPFTIFSSYQNNMSLQVFDRDTGECESLLFLQRHKKKESILLYLLIISDGNISDRMENFGPGSADIQYKCLFTLWLFLFWKSLSRQTVLAGSCSSWPHSFPTQSLSLRSESSAAQKCWNSHPVIFCRPDSGLKLV